MVGALAPGLGREPMLVPVARPGDVLFGVSGSCRVADVFCQQWSEREGSQSQQLEPVLVESSLSQTIPAPLDRQESRKRGLLAGGAAAPGDEPALVGEGGVRSECLRFPCLPRGGDR